MFDGIRSIAHRIVESRLAEKNSALASDAGGVSWPAGGGAAARTLNTAFLRALSHPDEQERAKAIEVLMQAGSEPEWQEAAQFYLRGLVRMEEEAEEVFSASPALHSALANVASDPSLDPTSPAGRERIWELFFPEAVGVQAERDDKGKALRERRTVRVARLNPTPVRDPARELLFTSNALLTTPSRNWSLDELPLPSTLRDRLGHCLEERQKYWYDHPIQIGVEAEKNEILYGLAGLERAMEFEVERGVLPADAKIPCLLSVSVTHDGLRPIASEYLEHEIERAGGLDRLDVHAFSEDDTDRMVDEVLVPAAQRYLGRDDAREAFEVFGVDGPYGRHYCFLKAVVPLWSIVVDPAARATFKIDLDQVFPQDELVRETGRSALEHLMTPLWGAEGTDADGEPVELGLLAGALVNQSDIHRGLFTSDVTDPGSDLAPDEQVFHSRVPQALSTDAELMTRYEDGGIDGKGSCLQRIHVTGGTTGAWVETLRRHRPFTPSFIGRAEDQAYLLHSLAASGTTLGYAHASGLIMRHDKEAFAQESMEAAYVGKLVGDYVRILYFSAYARVLFEDPADLKRTIDPFTGGFVSRLPLTVTHLRFALKAESFFAKGDAERGNEFVRVGSSRIDKACHFAFGPDAALPAVYARERDGWQLYYDTLQALEDAVGREEPEALALRDTARKLFESCRVRSGTARSTVDAP